MTDRPEMAGPQQSVFMYGQSELPAKIKLIKGQKNSYGWEISLAGTDFEEIIKKLADADMILAAKYGNQTTPEA